MSATQWRNGRKFKPIRLHNLLRACINGALRHVKRSDPWGHTYYSAKDGRVFEVRCFERVVGLRQVWQPGGEL